MFMGPNAKWFDLACSPKARDPSKGVTAGPEVTWEDGVRREYRVQPLCGASYGAAETRAMGLKWDWA